MIKLTTLAIWLFEDASKNINILKNDNEIPLKFSYLVHHVINDFCAENTGYAEIMSRKLTSKFLSRNKVSFDCFA